MVDSQPDLRKVLSAFAAFGATEAYVKVLAENDNTKNQVYFGPNFEVLHLLPHGELATDGSGDRTRYKAGLNLEWVDGELRTCKAPESKLILYPQYPEVRFSGFLRGCENGPSEHMRPRSTGYTIPRRILLFGVDLRSGKIYAYLAVERSPVFRELDEHLTDYEQRGVFYDITRMSSVIS